LFYDLEFSSLSPSLPSLSHTETGTGTQSSAITTLSFIFLFYDEYFQKNWNGHCRMYESSAVAVHWAAHHILATKCKNCWVEQHFSFSRICFLHFLLLLLLFSPFCVVVLKEEKLEDDFLQEKKGSSSWMQPIFTGNTSKCKDVGKKKCARCWEGRRWRQIRPLKNIIRKEFVVGREQTSNGKKKETRDSIIHPLRHIWYAHISTSMPPYSLSMQQQQQQCRHHHMMWLLLLLLSLLAAAVVVIVVVIPVYY